MISHIKYIWKQLNILLPMNFIKFKSINIYFLLLIFEFVCWQNLGTVCVKKKKNTSKGLGARNSIESLANEEFSVHFSRAHVAALEG